MRVACPHCKGKGDVPGQVDWFLAVFTMGVTALMDLSNRDDCKVCGGKGYVLKAPDLWLSTRCTSLP